ncbi:hypothetical protein B0H21DRAFT_888794 [Amylocystis lapponica]|nr:hypothetical protein B0H21DRAFT_888794 [Amylocystis lapponica]
MYITGPMRAIGAQCIHCSYTSGGRAEMCQNGPRASEPAEPTGRLSGQLAGCARMCKSAILCARMSRTFGAICGHSGTCRF